MDENERALEDMSENINKKEVQMWDLALAYIMIELSQNCKAAVRQMRCPAEVLAKLEKIFRVVSEATVDANLTTLQNVRSNDSKSIIEYLNGILELVSGLACPGHAASKFEQKCALV